MARLGLWPHSPPIPSFLCLYHCQRPALTVRNHAANQGVDERQQREGEEGLRPALTLGNHAANQGADERQQREGEDAQHES